MGRGLRAPIGLRTAGNGRAQRHALQWRGCGNRGFKPLQQEARSRAIHRASYNISDAA